MPFRILSYPHRVITAGMEKGLIKFEKERMRERLQLWTAYLADRGVRAEIGGLGEGAGFGVGGAYTIPTVKRQPLQFLGRASFKGYQEFDVLWSNALETGKLELEASYQWRPQENFYGLGHGSRKSQHTNFALRQSWLGMRWEVGPVKRLRAGAEYKVAALSAVTGQNPVYASSEQVFPNLPGFDRTLQLQSVGPYVEADLFQGEYRWGARAHLGASYQDALDDSGLEYFRYELSSRDACRSPPVAASSWRRGAWSSIANARAALRSRSICTPAWAAPRRYGASRWIASTARTSFS
jgi:hypothetical protein